MKRKILVSGILTILILSSLGVGIKHIGKEISESEKPKPVSFWDALFPFLTMVGGKLCNTDPDSWGSCLLSTERITCPSTVSGGCILDIWSCVDGNAYRYYEGERELAPGEAYRVYSGRTYELYYCDIGCTCDRYHDGGCGVECPIGSGDVCDADEMCRYRSCNDACDSTIDRYVCAYRTECAVATTSTTSPAVNFCYNKQDGKYCDNDIYYRCDNEDVAFSRDCAESNLVCRVYGGGCIFIGGGATPTTQPPTTTRPSSVTTTTRAGYTTTTIPVITTTTMFGDTTTTTLANGIIAECDGVQLGEYCIGWTMLAGFGAIGGLGMFLLILVIILILYLILRRKK